MTAQITLEEVEIVFGSGAGVYVRQALGRRSSVHESGDSEDGLDGNAVTLNAVPKVVKRGFHVEHAVEEL